jgi:hypothetical protein
MRVGGGGHNLPRGMTIACVSLPPVTGPDSLTRSSSLPNHPWLPSTDLIKSKLKSAVLLLHPLSLPCLPPLVPTALRLQAQPDHHRTSTHGSLMYPCHPFPSSHSWEVPSWSPVSWSSSPLQAQLKVSSSLRLLWLPWVLILLVPPGSQQSQPCPSYRAGLGLPTKP